MLVLRFAIWIFAAIGFSAVAALTWLWLDARPVLDEGRAAYETLPTELQCRRAGHARPPHYPAGPRELESVESAERSVYSAACRRANMVGQCVYLNGAVRRAGYSTFRRLYLSDCELRALSLHGDTYLGRALADLYPGRDPASLSDAEQFCLVVRTRYGHSNRYFCERTPSCCTSRMSADSSMPNP